MASLLAKTSKKVEELGKGLDEEDPACVVPPVGGNSCEELRAQMDALDGTRQRLKQEAKAAKALLVLLNKSESSSDEEDEDADALDRSSILATLTRISEELLQVRAQRKPLKLALEAMEQHGASSALPGMGMEISTVNVGQLFTGVSDFSQPGTQFALRERRLPNEVTALAPFEKTGQNEFFLTRLTGPGGVGV